MVEAMDDIRPLDARTRLLSVRVMVLTFAILLFGAGGPVLRTEFGYLGMAIAAGLVIGLGMLASSFVAPTSPPSIVQRVSIAALRPHGPWPGYWAISIRRTRGSHRSSWHDCSGHD